MVNTRQNTSQTLVKEHRALIAAIEKVEGRKVNEQEFILAKRLAQFAVAFPKGFRRYHVKG
jgi:hypothetical protein